MRQLLRVQVGVGADGSPVELDLNEYRHGLLVGAPGSGTSDLLRTLVTGLAHRHGPDQLTVLASDQAGPDQADAASRADRLMQTVTGELVRRQEVLREAGNFPLAAEYQRARAAGAALAPLPSLMVVCAGFPELLAARPALIDSFVSIGRLGNALGVHLLLAGERLDEGALRRLEVFLSYRIALRTSSAAESVRVIGVPDAYQLPPGHGYLWVLGSLTPVTLIMERHAANRTPPPRVFP